MDKVKKEIITQKRERSVNFSQKETELLVSLAEAKKLIIENKKSDATTWQDKEKAWKDIEKAFNISSGSVYRDHKHLKLKYEALKRDTRKKSAMVRAEVYRTGAGPNTAPVLTPVEQKVKMILISVEGNESYNDSDRNLPNTLTSDVCTQGYSSTQCNMKSLAAEELLYDDTIEEIVVKGGDKEDDDEPHKKKICKGSVPQEVGDQHCKPKEKKPFDILTEEKIEIAQLQKKIITEEMEQKLLQRKILEEEIEHKRAMWDLEKKHMLLKINLIEKEINK